MVSGLSCGESRTPSTPSITSWVLEFTSDQHMERRAENYLWEHFRASPKTRSDWVLTSAYSSRLELSCMGTMISKVPGKYDLLWSQAAIGTLLKGIWWFLSQYFKKNFYSIRQRKLKLTYIIFEDTYIYDV